MTEFVLDPIGLFVAMDDIAEAQRVARRSGEHRKAISVNPFSQLVNFVLIVNIAPIFPWFQMLIAELLHFLCCRLLCASLW